MKNQLKARIFSFFVIFSLLLSALGMLNFVARAATTVYVDGTASSGTSAPTNSSISFSHTTGTGTNRLLLVGVSWNCGTTDRTISTITFTPSGGSALAMTEVIKQLGYNIIKSPLQRDLPPACSSKRSDGRDKYHFLGCGIQWHYCRCGQLCGSRSNHSSRITRWCVWKWNRHKWYPQPVRIP